MHLRISEVGAVPVPYHADGARLLGQRQYQAKRHQAAEHHCTDILRRQIHFVTFQITNSILGVGWAIKIRYYQNAVFPARQVGLGNGCLLGDQTGVVLGNDYGILGVVNLGLS